VRNSVSVTFIVQVLVPHLSQAGIVDMSERPEDAGRAVDDAVLKAIGGTR
jgi:hypothetical protein